MTTTGPTCKRAEASAALDRILTLELAPNPDILANVTSRPNPPFCVGFAACFLSIRLRNVFIDLTSMNTAKATIRKLMMALRKTP